MNRTILLSVVLLTAIGCGGDPPPPAVGTKSITWAEYQKLSEQDQADPYILSHLDDNSRAKLAEKAKKQKQ